MLLAASVHLLWLLAGGFIHAVLLAGWLRVVGLLADWFAPSARAGSWGEEGSAAGRLPVVRLGRWRGVLLHAICR